MEKENGITLIALIITIIILLILAGISIATLTGENGILTKASTAKEESNKANAKEKVQLAVMSYQIDKEKTTVYDELIKVEGLTYITPDNRNDGPKYNVIVDGYEFVINEDLTIEYVGENKNQIIPEITKVEYETGEVEKLKIVITAKTEDKSGLKEIRVSYKTVGDGETKYETIKVEKVTGKETNVEVEIPINGEYVIEAIGVNNRIGKKEITISNIKQGNILATITSGAVNDQAQVMLTLKGEAQGTTIKAMELYVADKKVKSYEYQDLKTIKEETYTIENIEFYKDVECYVKVWGNNGAEVSSEVEIAKNTKIIKTATDLRNLSNQVNNENNTFQDKTIYLINDIAVGENWEPIGYWYGVKEDWSGRSFNGKFEGNNHNITINSLSKENIYKSTGLFGLGKSCTINNVTINGTLDASSECIGGIIGTIKDGTISGCTNNSIITDTSKSYHGGIVGNAENSQIENCINTNTIYGNSFVGGICGRVYLSSRISNCRNNCDETKVIKCYGVATVWSGNVSAEAGSVGGICGQTENSTIDNCSNIGEVTGNAITIVPKGICAGGIAGRIVDGSTVSTSKNTGIINFYTNLSSVGNAGSLGGVVGQAVNSTIEQSFNEGIVSSKYNNSYGMNFSGGIVGIINKSTVKNSYNIGEIYGDSMVGGMIGCSEANSGFTGKSELYNSYNASEIVEGNSYVGSSLGRAANTTGAYFSCLSNMTWGADPTNTCSWSNTDIYTLTQMKTTGSGLLTLLLNGYGTVNGKQLWAQEAGKNDGLPYLVNNEP